MFDYLYLIHIENFNNAKSKNYRDRVSHLIITGNTDSGISHFEKNSFLFELDYKDRI